ncbi:MAG: dockerin type I domain-containing protein, partial [Chthoniobacterales bacterium]
SWSIVTPPTPLGAQFFGVTCASAADCFAVGYYTLNSGSATLIEHWDGTSWSTVASRNPGPKENHLYGVTCASTADCWAVGDFYKQGAYHTLIEHWDGTSWSIVSSPNTSAGEYDDLFGVTCASAADCWAVGHYNPNGFYQTLIEHWDGTSWSIVTSPNTGFDLASVTCTSAADCWAVGTTVSQALIEHWDGTSWSIVTSPNTGLDLASVTCASASQCWAIGDYCNGNNVCQTLIEEYTPTIPPLASAVSRKVHGSAGTFDIPLPITGDPGIECRNPGATGTPGFDYKIVFSFVNNLASCGTASAGALSSGPGPNQCTVDLTGVADQQYLTIELDNVLDAQNNTGNVSATMGLLIGDTTADGSVNSGDIAQTKSTSGQTVDQSNFRTDVTVDGNLNSGDISLVKSESGTGLP